MKVGDLVKIANYSSRIHAYPAGHGIVVEHEDQGLHSMYNIVHVMWPETGTTRRVKEMFLEVISESR